MHGGDAISRERADDGRLGPANGGVNDVHCMPPADPF
jgi:hypothetical protein